MAVPHAFGIDALQKFGADGVWTVLILPSLRVSVVLAMTPVLYAMPVPNRVRALVIIALSIALGQALVPNSFRTPAAMGTLLEMAITEMAFGATMALGVVLAFAAFSVAGNLLDVQIGFGLAQVFDPVGNRASPLLVSAFNYVAVIGFMAADGHHLLLRALAYSFIVFPPGVAWQISDAAQPLFKQASGLFSLGFALAAPVVFCVLLVEFALGLIARNLPQINMLVLGIPVKIIVGMAVLSIWFAGMGATMNRIYSGIYKTWEVIFLEAEKRSAPGAQLPRGM